MRIFLHFCYRHMVWSLIVTALVCAILLFALDISASEDGSTETLSGTEVGEIFFRSTSPHDFIHQIEGSAPSVRVSGVLDFPDEAGAAPIPAVVLLHGIGGRGAWISRYVETLHKAGIATFILESFSARGVVSIGRDHGAVSEQAMMADAFAALRLLRSDPRIDADRIAVMGFSKGGSAALYAAFDNVARWYEPDPGLHFAAHIAFFPSCSAAIESPALTGAPVLMLLGGEDDYAPAKECAHLGRRTPQERETIQYTVYENAHHGFTAQDPVRRYDFFNLSDCAFHFGIDGITVDTNTGDKASTLNQRVIAFSRCASIGMTMGGNAIAQEASSKEMAAFLRRTFNAPTRSENDAQATASSS